MAFKTSDDPRLAPAYSVAEAAHYLRIPEETLRSWVVGRLYPVAGQWKRSRALIHLGDPKRQYLSFINLVEAHVLAAIRRRHGVKLPKVRNALDYVRRQFRVEHPLIGQYFQTDGLDLFVERYGDLINASRDGQRAMMEIIGVYLKRIEWDARGLPIKLYPFTRDTQTGAAPASEPARRRHESGHFFWAPGNHRNGHTCFIHLRAIQGWGFDRGSCAGLPFGDRCDRRSHPLRSRLMGLFSLSKFASRISFAARKIAPASRGPERNVLFSPGAEVEYTALSGGESG